MEVMVVSWYEFDKERWMGSDDRLSQTSHITRALRVGWDFFFVVKFKKKEKKTCVFILYI